MTPFGNLIIQKLNYSVKVDNIDTLPLRTILFIERGRWSNIAFENRKCLLCNEIEDEYHFVVVCIKFHELRIKYLPKLLYLRPSMFKFVNFLNSKNVSDLKKLGLFLHHAFNLYNKDEIFA